MNAEEFEVEVKKLLKSEIKFDGHIKLIVDTITEDRQNVILIWINDCKLAKIKPEPCKNFKNFISFVYKSNDNRIRGILTKEKNSYFIELFLDKHKYYDRKRKYLGI